MKRIISLLLVMLLVVSTTVFASDAAVVAFGTATVDGDNVTVPVTLEAIPSTMTDLSSITINYTFDKTKLTYVGCDTVIGGITGAIVTEGNIAWMNPSLTDPGPGAAELAAASNVLFNLKFTKVSGATGDAEVKITAADFMDTWYSAPASYSLGNTVVSLGGAVIEPAEVNWATGTDAGFYTVDEDVFGLMRFLFDVSTEGVVTETGIKYLKAEDITATITGAEVSGAATTFYGDVVAIPEGTAGTYYAAAYAVVDGETRWSAPVACTPDFVKAVIK